MYRPHGAIGRSYKNTKQMITGGIRNMMFTDFYRQYADEDSKDRAEDMTVDTTTELPGCSIMNGD